MDSNPCPDFGRRELTLPDLALDGGFGHADLLGALLERIELVVQTPSFEM